MSFARWTAVVLAASILTSGSAVLLLAQDFDNPFTFVRARPDGFRADRVTGWALAALRHRPGEWDAEAKLIAGDPNWDSRRLAGAVADFESLRKQLARSAAGDLTGTPLEAQLATLLEMRPEEIRRRDPTRILKRAILLHTDIAVLSLSAQSTTDTTSLSAVPALHFGVAMALADALAEEFGEERLVRSWYVATAAFLHWQRDVSSAPPFVRRAVAKVPGDEELLTLAGGVHEFLASPRVQNSDWAESVRERGLPLRKPHEYLLQAERSYEEVLRSSPSLTEVRVHLGRVLGELKRLDEAAMELTEATRNAGSNDMHYLAWLFLGDTQAALHRAAEAEAAYSRAIALFPAAPSAHTALSLHARRRGEHRLAREALALQTAARTNDTDPWDAYFDVGVTKQAEALLDALRRRLTVVENVQ